MTEIFFRSVPIVKIWGKKGGKMTKVHAKIGFLAKRFKMTERYAQEIFVKARIEKGEYNLAEACSLYVEYRDEQLKKLNADRDKLLEIKGEREKVRLEKEIFNLDVLKEDYHKTEDIEIFFAGLIAQLKSKITAIPSKGARLVAGETEIGEVEKILKSFTDEILKDLAEMELMEE